MASVLTTVGTISVHGQVPQKTPAPGAQPATPPVYPSATFDAQTSAQMTAGMGGRDSFFVYLSTDPAAKVAAFYAAKLGRKAEKMDEGSFAFHLTDHGALPDLTIESNLTGPLAGKTVITFVKHQR